MLSKVSPVVQSSEWIHPCMCGRAHSLGSLSVECSIVIVGVLGELKAPQFYWGFGHLFSYTQLQPLHEDFNSLPVAYTFQSRFEYLSRWVESGFIQSYVTGSEFKSSCERGKCQTWDFFCISKPTANFSLHTVL